MSENRTIEASAFTRARESARKPLLAPSPLKVALLVSFLLLAAVTWFMFNARAVRLAFQPETATVQIKSILPVWQLGESHLLLSGDYEFTARADGYYPLHETLKVTRESDQRYRYELTKLPGRLKVTASFNSQPVTDADVHIDQVLIGKTPLTLDEIAAGKRNLRLQHPRFRSIQQEIDIIGMRQFQEREMQLEAAWANISLASQPAAASISVDGELAGETPASIEMLEGTRSLLLQKPGYKTFATLLTVEAGEDQQLPPVNLVKADGKLNITSQPEGVNVTISGQYYGQTPLFLALPPDDYQLLASRAGYEQYTRKFAIRSDKEQNLNLRLIPVTGQIRLAATPEGARLFIDDKPAGEADQTLELPARKHRLRIELPGYATWTTQVTPQPGLPQQLNVTLQTEEEARISAIPQQITTSLGDVLRLVLPGKMKMGAGRREPGRRANEIEKEVELTRAFYLGEKEISNEVFNNFKPAHNSGMMGRALLNDPERPAVNLSWEDAIKFCNWLSKRDGLPVAYERRGGIWQLHKTRGYRLPTEAEWAWAARYAAREPTRFPWGEAMPPPDGFGNFADISAENMVPYSIRGYMDKFRGPAPSGSYAANELGIFDLAGNVSEWIHDYYSVELQRELLIDPLGPKTGDYHVIRGSNYAHGRFSELRWTFRNYGADARPDTGFRIARYVE